MGDWEFAMSRETNGSGDTFFRFTRAKRRLEGQNRWKRRSTKSFGSRQKNLKQSQQDLDLSYILRPEPFELRLNCEAGTNCLQVITPEDKPEILTKVAKYPGQNKGQNKGQNNGQKRALSPQPEVRRSRRNAPSGAESFEHPKAADSDAQPEPMDFSDDTTIAAHGPAVAWAIHASPDGDSGWRVPPHAHLLITTRVWRHDARHGATVPTWCGPAMQARLHTGWLARLPDAMRAAAATPYRAGPYTPAHPDCAALVGPSTGAMSHRPLRILSVSMHQSSITLSFQVG